MSLHRAVGLYFLVSALEYIPAGVFMLGVQNPYGPAWVIPATPLAQGVITAIVGLWLYRSEQPTATVGIVSAPSLQSVLQLFGVYFLLSGLVSAVRQLSSILFFSEALFFSASANLASAVTSILIGGYLIARPQPLAAYLKHAAEPPASSA